MRGYVEGAALAIALVAGVYAWGKFSEFGDTVRNVSVAGREAKAELGRAQVSAQRLRYDVAALDDLTAPAPPAPPSDTDEVHYDAAFQERHRTMVTCVTNLIVPMIQSGARHTRGFLHAAARPCGYNMIGVRGFTKETIAGTTDAMVDDLIEVANNQ